MATAGLFGGAAAAAVSAFGADSRQSRDDAAVTPRLPSWLFAP